jgi:hypothetical protein
MSAIRTVEEVVALACQMPAEFYRRGNVSMLGLVEESNYRAHQSLIGIEDIFRYLQGHSNLVDEWRRYSEDKRTGTGWYFDYATRRVGYFSGSCCEREQIFDDVTKTCAVFIKHELDSITDHSN